MKKNFYCLIFGVLLFSSPAAAQVFEGKGDISLNAGLSLGVIGYGYGFYGPASFAIPLTLNLEYGIHEMFSVGPYLGYLRRSYGDFHSFSSLAFGAQGVLHATPFLNESLDMGIDEEKVDFYAKVILGYQAYSWRYKGEGLTNGYYSGSGSAIFSPVLGIRYMLKPNFGGFAEAGRGAFGVLTLGLSLKL